jgi:hypothetical protein
VPNDCQNVTWTPLKQAKTDANRKTWHETKKQPLSIIKHLKQQLAYGTPHLFIQTWFSGAMFVYCRVPIFYLRLVATRHIGFSRETWDSDDHYIWTRGPEWGTQVHCTRVWEKARSVSSTLSTLSAWLPYVFKRRMESHGTTSRSQSSGRRTVSQITPGHWDSLLMPGAGLDSHGGCKIRPWMDHVSIAKFTVNGSNKKTVKNTSKYRLLLPTLYI